MLALPGPSLAVACAETVNDGPLRPAAGQGVATVVPAEQVVDTKVVACNVEHANPTQNISRVISDNLSFHYALFDQAVKLLFDVKA